MKKLTLVFLFVMLFGDSAFAQITWMHESDFFIARRPWCLLFNDQAKLFVGESHGLFTSTDLGATWDSVADLSQISVGALAMAPNHTMYAAGERELFTPAGPEGVWRSKDHGATWKLVTLEWGSLRTHAVVVLADGTVLAGTEWGALRSTDEGDHWSISNSGYIWGLGGSGNGFSQMQTLDGHMLIGNLGYRGLAKSTNGGTLWSRFIEDSLKYKSFTPDRAGNVFAKYYRDQTSYGLAVSHDLGATWTEVPCPSIAPIDCLIPATNGWLLELGFKHHYSTDQGQSWILVSDGMDNTNGASLPVESPDGHIIFLQYNGRVYRSVDPLPTSGVHKQSTDAKKIVTFANPSSQDLTLSVANAEYLDLSSYDVLGYLVLREHLLPGTNHIHIPQNRKGMLMLRFQGKTDAGIECAFERKVMVE